MSYTEFAKHAIVAAAVLIALLALWTAGSAVAVFLASLAIAATAHPLVEHYQQRGWHASIVASCIAGAVVLLLAVLSVGLGPSLLADAMRMEEDLSLNLSTLAQESPDHWLVRRPPDTEEADSPALAPSLLRTVAGPLVGTASSLFELSALSGICLALAFYWTLDRERFERLWLSLLPVGKRVGAQRMWRSIEREVGSYLRSELCQFLIAVLLLWGIFRALDVRYPTLAAIIAGTLTLIPWLGTLFASAAVLVLTSPKLVDWSGPWFNFQSGVAIVAIVLVLLFLEFVVEPRLFQRDRYNALWIGLTAILMASLWGFWGLVFGPMVGYVLQIFVRQAYPRLVQERPEITSEAVLRERLVLLEERFAENTDAPPELLSLKQRLLDIVAERDEVLPNQVDPA
jgi:predicted PurR-regulated permease PerM